MVLPVYSGGLSLSNMDYRLGSLNNDLDELKSTPVILMVDFFFSFLSQLLEARNCSGNLPQLQASAGV